MECEPNITFISVYTDSHFAASKAWNARRKYAPKSVLNEMHDHAFIGLFIIYPKGILCPYMHVLYANVIKDTQKRNNYLGPFRSNKHQSVVVHFIISSFFFLLSSCVPIPILFFAHRERTICTFRCFLNRCCYCCYCIWRKIF